MVLSSLKLHIHAVFMPVLLLDSKLCEGAMYVLFTILFSVLGIVPGI